MTETDIAQRVHHDLAFLLKRQKTSRAGWNDLTTRFNAHLVSRPGPHVTLDHIRTFWSSQPIGDIGRLSLASMVAQGHAVTLYTYDDREAVRSTIPSGVRIVDAVSVLPREVYELCLAKSEIRFFSDMFRYAVLYQEGGWWLDADVVLLKPLAFPGEHIFSTQWGGTEVGHVCVGDVMRAPVGSPHMRALYELAMERFLAGRDLGFGAVGPLLLTQYVLAPERAGLIASLLPPTHFNAIDWTEVERFVAGDRSGFDLLRDDRVTGIHLWAKAWADKGLTLDQAMPGSVAGYLKTFFGSHNPLDQLAMRYDSDKGTRYRGRTGHGYVRVYHDLFRTQVMRPLRILEIGLCRGLVEGWAQDQVPSLLAWLEYFPNAHVVGADIQDFSWFEHPRAEIHRIDQSSREMLTKFVSEQSGLFDIIIDDASHASPHQQLTLGLLYPLLKPNGIYIVEDLDWQPEEFELPHVKETKELLQILKKDSIFDSIMLTKQESRYVSESTSAVEFHDSYSELLYRNLHGGLGVLRKKSSVLRRRTLIWPLERIRSALT